MVYCGGGSTAVVRNEKMCRDKYIRRGAYSGWFCVKLNKRIRELYGAGVRAYANAVPLERKFNGMYDHRGKQTRH